jgi:hypothetical protein
MLEGLLARVVKVWPRHARLDGQLVRLGKSWSCYAKLDCQLASLEKACARYAKHRQRERVSPGITLFGLFC